MLRFPSVLSREREENRLSNTTFWTTVSPARRLLRSFGALFSELHGIMDATALCLCSVTEESKARHLCRGVQAEEDEGAILAWPA